MNKALSLWIPQNMGLLSMLMNIDTKMEIRVCNKVCVLDVAYTSMVHMSRGSVTQKSGDGRQFSHFLRNRISCIL